MSYFDGKIEWSPENEKFRDMLEKLGEEAKKDADTLRMISDDVFTAIASEAVDLAARTAFKPRTRERKARVNEKRKRRKRKRERGKKKNYDVAALARRPIDPAFTHGLVAALTAPHDKRNAVAHRVIGNGTLEWGTKRWVDYAHPHITGTKRGLPARLAMLQPKHFEGEAIERTRDVLAASLGAKLEAAGAPTEWIQEVLEGRY